MELPPLEQIAMGMKNVTGVRKEIRCGKPHWILDFRYTSKTGERLRYRRDATVQNYDAAVKEAKRLMALAAETGSLETTTKKTSLTLSAFVDGTFETLFMPKYRPATQVRYRDLLRQSVRPTFGDVPLEQIDGTKVRAFAAALQLRKVQIKGPVNFVRTILRAAVEVGAIDAFPELPSLIKASKKLPDAPSSEELAAMVSAADGWLKVAIVLAAYGGLRMGEVRGLEVRDVDLKGGRLLVRRALSEDVELTPKSGHDRVVPMHPELVAVMTEAVKGKLPKARVVVEPDGTTPRRQRVLAAIKGLQKKNGLRERSFHSLRHYFCSTLVRRGAPVEAVRVLAGHSNLAVTQRYVHASGADLADAIAKMATAK